jgi:hypothetical protein
MTTRHLAPSAVARRVAAAARVVASDTDLEPRLYSGLVHVGAYAAQRMASTPEELALDLSRASIAAQEQSENQLREKATAVLGAASIVVPVAALAIGDGPAGAAIPLGFAAFAFVLLVRECGAALVPRNVHAGLLGAELLETAKRTDADLRQMQAAAASYLDAGYRHNQGILEDAAGRVGRAIVLLTVEILSLVVALIVTLLS